MLTSLKGHALLTGFRGKPGVDIDALVDTICRLSELAHDLRDVIDQIDVNPVIASNERGHRCGCIDRVPVRIV